MIRAVAVVGLAVLAGCPGPTKTGPDEPRPVATTDAASGAPDARVIDEDERLAMIQAAMNQLAPVANQCWAAGAVDDYLLKGTVTLLIQPRAGGGGAAVEVAHDTTDDKVLKECLATVIAAYAWPAELAGEAIELPFGFDAPDGQFVIDRRLVPFVGQAGVGVGVLLDEKNSNNPAASMLELMFKDGAALELAKAERHEVWYITGGAGQVGGPGKAAATELAPGAVIDVPAGAYRSIKAGGAGLGAVVFVIPGQIEGVARGGAMPGERVGSATVKGAGPRVITASKSYPGDKRVADIYLDSAGKGASKDIALSVLHLEAGAEVPEHVHANETEMLYLIAGEGSMVIDGVTLPVTSSTVVQIPKGVKHRATATAAIRAIQIYTPGGPEQRFKK